MTVKSMNTTEDKKIELEIEVDAAIFEKAVEASYKKNSKRMSLPGFRKGKAPRKMLEKYYGEGVFYEDAVNATFPEAYDAAVEEKKLEPVERPNIEVLEIGAQGYTFKATVSVKPEVTLGEYKGLSVEKKIRTATDEEVDKEISQRRDQSGRMVSAGDREAKLGDTAVIDFDGSVDGVPFDGGKSEKFNLVLGSGSFIDGFEDQIVGHKAGDEFDVNVTFPENYHAEELKGKPAVFKCVIHDLLVKELPELDDEFAKDVSEFDTLDELKADIRKKLQDKYDDASQTEVENKLLEQVCASMSVEVPDCMYESRMDDMVREFEYRLQSQGMNLKTYLNYMGLSLENFRETFRERAQMMVKTRLALEAIVDAEKLEASDEEVQKEYEKLASDYNVDVERARALVPEKELNRNLCMGKALDMVRDSAVITEVEYKDETGEAKDDTKAEDEEKAEEAPKPKRRRKTSKEKEAAAE